jgi:2-isopropylmalate synthase
MKKLFITDITMRGSNKQDGNSLSFKEKLEIAKLLDELKVDVIELAPSLDDKAELLLIRTISTFIKNSTLSCLAGKSIEDIDIAFESIANAKHKRLLISFPMSFAQMEYSYHQKPAMVIESIEKLVKYAKTLCQDVEVVLEDSTRSDMEFLCKAVNTAIDAGASTITIYDLTGRMLPEEFGEFVSTIYEKVPVLSKVNLGVQCSNYLSMANANTFAGVKAGANNIKCSAVGGLVASLETINQTLIILGDKLGLKSNLNTTELVRIIKRISQFTRSIPEAKQITEVMEDNSENLDANITLTNLMAIIKKRGYDLSREDSAKVYEEFQRLAKKKNVNLKELDVIIASTALQVPSTYKLINYVINSGNIIASTASVYLNKDGKELYGLSTGDGPIDSAFMAIESITGHHYELDDFQIQSVTEGREAVGEGLVKLRNEGKLYSGRGASTDIIGASIRAYLNALNKIVYEESNK